MSEPELSPIAYGEFVSDVHAIADALQGLPVPSLSAAYTITPISTQPKEA